MFDGRVKKAICDCHTNHATCLRGLSPITNKSCHRFTFVSSFKINAVSGHRLAYAEQLGILHDRAHNPPVRWQAMADPALDGVRPLAKGPMIGRISGTLIQ
ncbi:hypothetical protein RCCS2_16541 [Roseobacter sp. CCS2]|nr:hypothetical protein RCCS2_16541 [Roseobacter sp. CCS2]